MSRSRIVNQLQRYTARQSNFIKNLSPFVINQAADEFTTETVEGVNSTNSLIKVLDVWLPKAGDIVFAVDDLATVAWKNKKPYVILGHKFQKAQYPPRIVDDAVGIEELLLLKVDGVWDVWFRDSEKFVTLNLSSYFKQVAESSPPFEQTPLSVKWGLGQDTFVVYTEQKLPWPTILIPGNLATVPKFYIFKINRKRKRRAISKKLQTTLVATLAPSPINSGYGDNKPAPGSIHDFILTKDLDVLILTSVNYDKTVVYDTLFAPSFTVNISDGSLVTSALLVWSAKNNNVVSNLMSFNQEFDEVPGIKQRVPVFFPTGGPSGGITVYASNSTNQLTILNTKFMFWDINDVSKQAIFCSVSFDELYTTGFGDTFGFGSSNGVIGDNLLHKIKNWIITPSFHKEVWPDQNIESSTSSPNLNPYYMVSSFAMSESFLLLSVELIEALGDIRSGTLYIYDRKKQDLITISGRINIPLSEFSDIEKALLFFRFIDNKLYSIPINGSFTSYPFIPILKQRHMFVKIPPQVFPVNKLKKIKDIILSKKIKAWPKTLEVLEETSQISFTKTDYRLVK